MSKGWKEFTLPGSKVNSELVVGFGVGSGVGVVEPPPQDIKIKIEKSNRCFIVSPKNYFNNIQLGIFFQ